MSPQQQVNVKLDDGLVRQLDTFCNHYHLTRREAIERAISVLTEGVIEEATATLQWYLQGQAERSDLEQAMRSLGWLVAGAKGPGEEGGDA